MMHVLNPLQCELWWLHCTAYACRQDLTPDWTIHCHARYPIPTKKRTLLPLKSAQILLVELSEESCSIRLELAS